jgi:hypothetical protein
LVGVELVGVVFGVEDFFGVELGGVELRGCDLVVRP